MSAAQTRLDVAAENLANASNDGFRKTRLRGFLRAAGIAMARERDTSQGALRRTGRDLDLAISGSGAFNVRDASGKMHTTRGGAFMRDRFERLCDERGRVVIGTRGPVLLPDGAHIEPGGAIVRNGTILNRIPLPPGSALRTGFLESSNVDTIGEMIDVLTSQRSFETAQKVLEAIDKTRERNTTQTALVRE